MKGLDTYGYTREEITGALDKILRTAQFEIVTKDIMWKAWESYRDGKGDFADYYLGHQCHDAGASSTLTFDKVLGQSNLFEVLKA
ncbi:MAG TPA: hypothetical protein PKE26_05580 [Kiritimatiellia bacterium]|nr:hypothetical protein [Kiritimatiellia bacterium]HMO98564.1 hypothetical protein [Kiritimatiellia bacterium]HMP97604.1 hypothetical protein [Kiritimatiellia bacterium]